MVPDSMRMDHRTARQVESLSRTTAALSAAGCIILWSVFLWANPYAPVDGATSHMVGILMILVWSGGLVALFREIVPWIYVTFVLAFVPAGLYLLGAPGLFAWIGVLTLVYMAAGIAWQRSRLRSRS